MATTYIYAVHCETCFDEYTDEFICAFANENDAKKYVDELTKKDLLVTTTYYYEKLVLL